MTFSLLCQHDGAVYCVADTAITGLAGLATEHSSFGEKHKTEGRIIQEALLKIVPLGTHGLVTFAGSYQNALNYRVELQRLVAEGGGVDDSMAAAGETVITRDELDHVEMLVGWTDGSGSNTRRWSSRTPNEIERDPEICWAGSMPPDLADAVVTALRYTLATKPKKNWVLPSLLGVAQSMGVHDYLIEKGVGGAFVGAKADIGGFSWQEDTTYFVYPPYRNQSLPLIVTTLVRDDIAAAMSHNNGEHNWIPLPNKIDMLKDMRWWVDKWDASVFEIFRHLKCRYFIFLSIKERRMVILESEERSAKNKYLGVEVAEGINIGATQELLDYLFGEISIECDFSGSCPQGFS